MCKICSNLTTEIKIKSVSYHKCFNCGFIYKDDKHILDSLSEFKRYKLHENFGDGYSEYQNRFFNEIKQFLSGNILDYGCGDNHILANIISENNYPCDFYDLYFYPSDNYLKKEYDVIILEEVIEHLKNPKYALANLVQILRKNGKIIIKTMLLKDKLELEKWWYLRDETHISFFSYKTFCYLCEFLNLNIIYCNEKDIIILQKV